MIFHEMEKEFDTWGAKIYCRCGLVFAEPYRNEVGIRPLPNRETGAERDLTGRVAVERWWQHRQALGSMEVDRDTEPGT